MDYEKKYKDALERGRKVLNNEDVERTTMEYLFPELKESKDVRIRKELKHYLEVTRCQTHSDEEYVNCNRFLAWLEKQGDKSIFMLFSANKTTKRWCCCHDLW